ncbi:MAG: LUD domain-containing protein [Chitinophagia bacterium]|jgi:L-lactate dehydrogenase complex protein LldG
MESQGARQKILQKIKQALKDPVPVPFPDQVADTPVFIPTEKELAIEFAQKFNELLGKFVYCADEQELIKQLNALIITKGLNKIYSKETTWLASLRPLQFDPITTNNLEDCDAAITLCTHLVARTGSIVLSSKESSGRTASVYAPIHICIAYVDQLVYDISDSLKQLKEDPTDFPSMISYATGPSRTADIEKTLVVGVHGPKEVYCFLIDNPLEL